MAVIPSTKTPEGQVEFLRVEVFMVEVLMRSSADGSSVLMSGLDSQRRCQGIQQATATARVMAAPCLS